MPTKLFNDTLTGLLPRIHEAVNQKNLLVPCYPLQHRYPDDTGQRTISSYGIPRCFLCHLYLDRDLNGCPRNRIVTPAPFPCGWNAIAIGVTFRIVNFRVRMNHIYLCPVRYTITIIVALIQVKPYFKIPPT